MTRPARSHSAGEGLRRVADHLGFALLWCWILVSMFFVPALLGYWWLGTILFLLGLIVCWQAAEATRDPVYAIGTRREVRTGRVEDDRVDCDECGRSARGGEYRRYERRRVLFGTTIAVLESGENVYCEACSIDPRDRDGREVESTLESGMGVGSPVSDAEREGDRR
ncbi:hypothetical protein [Natrarchaeobius oligotrophus]|uniref:DUF8108 domain-containing protein n=1 Tax=Natrarchaeobius chitinivorans TaxID=1679083 RepID=A0A3N6MH02_NATCH|nr:hypothetical protein [Natrarchaeobius chitinivorans]RQH03384.1 hypothetical protein EA472_02115 [Natrarchaeobius chitinivorans]